jgi:hypothetical protein
MMLAMTRDQAAGAARPPTWSRWAVPSITDQLFIGLLCVPLFTGMSVTLLADADIGWHIRAGQDAIAHLAIPRIDLFTSTMAGKPWFDWEWLSDIVVALLVNSGGLNGVVWLAALVVAVTFACMFRLLIVRGTSFLFALGLVLLALGTSMLHFLARPHVLSWLLTLAFYWILDSTERAQNGQQARRLWLLPVLMLLWVNLHGSFLLGLVLVAIFWVAALSIRLWPSAAPESRETQKAAAVRRMMSLTTTGVACVVATLLNPWGWKLYPHVLRYLSDRLILESMDELHSPNFHDLAPECFLLLLLATLVVMVARAREVRPSQLLVALFATYSGLYAARAIPTSALLLSMVLGPLVKAGPSRLARELREMELRQRGHLWAIAAVTATAAIALHGGRFAGFPVMNARFDPHHMPVAAVEFIKTSTITEPIFAPDAWGGYLIYELYPARHVVLDDRFDLFGDTFMKSYMRTMAVQRGWEQLLHASAPACIVLRPDDALTNILKATREWKTVYSDDVAVVLVPARRGDI